MAKSLRTWRGTLCLIVRQSTTSTQTSRLTVRSRWRATRASLARRQLRRRQSKLPTHKCHPPLSRAQRGTTRTPPYHARPGANMEPQVQLPLDVLQRRSLHRRVQETHASRNQSKLLLPHHPVRTLGYTILDLSRPFRRICPHPRGEQCAILKYGVLPPNVPLELRHVLPPPCTRKHKILLARGA